MTDTVETVAAIATETVIWVIRVTGETRRNTCLLTLKLLVDDVACLAL